VLSGLTVLCLGAGLWRWCRPASDGAVD
jgi:hypothetical protein